MALWFECKVRFDKMMENGSVKKVTESYLVDALSFTEAEARIIEECKPYISGDFSIPAIKKTNIAEIFFNNCADKWWSVKYNIITIDEKSAKERRTAVYVHGTGRQPTGSYRHFQQRHEGNYGRLRDRKGCRDKNHRYLSGKAVFNKWNGKS